MNLRKNRRLNPRPGPVILGYLFLGLLCSGLFVYGWAHLALARMQRQCFVLYAETSIPLIKTVSRNGVRHALGEKINPRDQSRVAKAPVYGTLHDLIYKGRDFTAIVQLPAETGGGIILAFLLTGGIVANRKRRALENGITLRGPEKMSVRQFNRANRGPGGMELNVYEIKN